MIKKRKLGWNLVNKWLSLTELHNYINYLFIQSQPKHNILL